MLYVKDVQATCDFYESHFGFMAERTADDRVVELMPPNGGVIIMVHAAAKGVKTGQVTVKLVFDIEDVNGFREKSLAKDLVFGAIHQAKGYTFANAKDPDGNSISISSRAFAAPVN
jgi:catechol 2,3-dioxygenase-like lactoylglutathione lyase family enzyme